MTNRYARILAAGGAAVLVAALGVPAALAADIWTVQSGGGIHATSGKFTVTDTSTGTVLGCRSPTARGKLKTGSGLPGSRAGSLSAVDISGCGGALGRTQQPGGLTRRLASSRW